MGKGKGKVKENQTKKKPDKKGGKKMGPDAVAMKAKAQKAENPFESIWSRQRFPVLGKKNEGGERRVGLSRSRAVDKRKNTLLKEYEQSLKASVFMDNRIGEHNDELGEFDKAIIRSQRERQLKLAKKSMYNLSDGEEDIYEDGALGGSSVKDDFDSGLLSDEDLQDDDLEGAGSKRLKHLNRNRSVDPSGEEERHKSKKEVMEEIIMKSKLGRMEKAKQKEEKEKLMDELNKDFMSLVDSEAMKSLTQPFRLQEDKNDDYYKLMDAMSMDIRGRPSERTKTPEEIAQKEREKLVALEAERKKRMQETEDLSDGDEESGGEESAKRLRSVSGDDLGDSFSVDEEQPKKGWINEVLEREDGVDNSENDEDDGSSEDSESEGEDDDDDGESDGCNNKQRKGHPLKDWEQSDDELEAELEDDTDDDDDDEEQEEPRVNKKSKNDYAAPSKGEALSETVKQKTNMKKLSSTQRDIAYVIDAPKNYEELIALVEDCSNEDVILIVSRIRTNNSIKVAAENRKKMQVFYGILLQYFAVLANKKPLNFELLNMLVKPLIEMSMEIPYFAAICARQRLLKTRAQFCEAIKNPEDGCWPSLKTLFLLRLWSMIFPCSDYRHAVMTPSILLMCEYLMRCPISSGRDIAIGSFLCSIVLVVAKQSKKFCPEAILFIRTLLMAASDKKSPSEESEFYHFMELKSLTPLLCIQDHVKEVVPLNFLKIMDQPADSPYFSSDEFRASIISSVVDTLRGFVEINGGLSSFPEIFMPISTLSHQVGNQEKIPQTLKEKLEDVAQLIEKKTDEHRKQRKPLAMRKHKPIAIRMVNPKFEENFVKGRDYDPDKARSEHKKLKKLLKQERKGAGRELRKDSYFMSEVKAKEKAAREQERAEKHGKNWAFLQEQEHAFKSGQLGKGKGKKRKR
ncbi:hypothetical protein EUTSA_v10018096mg [Eutrema salsugineum]|uniref:Nucleolar protein 14 n=1 Tax=Eutrema salsugineum TaxID=72664 RepID=V4JSQ7_EUTSA|nr:nucleolar protein 14 [Eutrema salsugineum]ESQ28345.1 hypothetical protein EUTSA_v10018096mg [Eutrema salsugineum]